jgi:D-glycero-beta-D-manno-heptose-7-phosphate kinase
MNNATLPERKVKKLLEAAAQARVLVLGDLMLDQFVWGHVARISPEAPVPVVEFQRESLIPGGAGNVARNLATLGASTELFGVIGKDDAGRQLKRLLAEQQIGCAGVFSSASRSTSMKTRIIAHQQQVVRVDRESRDHIHDHLTGRLLVALDEHLNGAAALIVGDYGKGVVSQELLDEVRARCRERGIWISLDPKPVHSLDLSNLSLITPNRKEAFELAGVRDGSLVDRPEDPLQDMALMRVAEILLHDLAPALLLITLGDQGMLLCQRGRKPFHIPTVAREVFDVSGAGDTVIASFTLAIAGGASPVEAAVFSNHAAGVVVRKIGTATVTPEELLASFQS